MRIKKDYQPLMEEYVQRQKKSLPYTITEIGGPEEYKVWKAIRFQKQKDWEARQTQKRDEIIQGMLDGTLASKDAAGGFGVSEATKTHERYKKQQNVRIRAAQDIISAPSEKPSIITRISNWIIDKLTSINLP